MIAFHERSMACLMCRTRCETKEKRRDPAAACPLPAPKWEPFQTQAVRLGDVVEKLAKPIARVLKMRCLDEHGNLKPESGCGKRKAWLNRLELFNA